MGGAGLAGAALLGVACCGGQKDEGLVRLVLSHGEGSEALRDQIRKFNQQNRGAIEVALRLAPADSGQYFETLSSVPVITLGREAIRSVRSRPVTPLYYESARSNPEVTPPAVMRSPSSTAQASTTSAPEARSSSSAPWCLVRSWVRAL